MVWLPTVVYNPQCGVLTAHVITSLWNYPEDEDNNLKITIGQHCRTNMADLESLKTMFVKSAWMRRILQKNIVMDGNGVLLIIIICNIY